MTDNMTSLARGIFRVLETGDAALARDVVGGDFHNREASSAPAACSSPGPAGLLASSAWMRSAFSELRFDILSVGHDGDVAWVHLRMQGMHTGPFVLYENGAPAQVVPPTGRRIDFEQIHLLTFSEGRIVDHLAVRDDLTMLGQLQVFPPNPRTLVALAAFAASGRKKRAIRRVEELTTAAAQETP